MLTLEKIQETYLKSVNSLNRYCNHLIMNIQRSMLRLQIKNIRIQRVKLFYEYTLKNIIKKRDEDLLLINKKEYKALLVGIEYKNTSYQLNGTINDIESMTKFLESKNIPKDKMCILTDDTDIKPSKENIINYFKKLLMESNSGDNIVFFYSGHGSTVVNDSLNKDTEPLDDVLITLDSNYIIDDELNLLIQNHLKPDVTLFVLFDCCHSGTMLDLKYNYPMDSSLPNVMIDNGSSGNTKSNVYYISGCKDNQTSIETNLNSKVQGALTFAFLSSTSRNKKMSWNKLVLSIRDIMKENNFLQIPQFSSGLPCDLNSLWTFSNN